MRAVPHPMKTSSRLALVLFTGLSLAGCASQTARIDLPANPKVASWGDQPLHSRDYWLQREYDEKIDRALGVC